MDLLRQRLLQLRERLAGKFFKIPDFDDRAKVQEITGPMPDMDKYLVKYEKSKKSEFAELYPYCISPLLEREQEYHLLRHYNYLKYQCKKILSTQDIRRKPSEAAITEAEKLFQALKKPKDALVNANMRLVLNICKKMDAQSPGKRDFDELLSDGTVGLVQCIDWFDFRRGIKLCTYAYWSIRDQIIGASKNQHKIFSVTFNNNEEILELALDRDNDEVHPTAADIKKLLKGLEPRQKEILLKSTGACGYGEGMTLAQMAKHYGISKERVRQIREASYAQVRKNKRIPENVQAFIDRPLWQLESLRFRRGAYIPLRTGQG